MRYSHDMNRESWSIPLLQEEESEVSLSMFEVYNEELKDLLDPQKKKMDMIMTKVRPQFLDPDP